MKFKLLLPITLYLLLVATSAQAQDGLPTENIPKGDTYIPIEIFSGNKAYALQLIVSKQFSAKSKFGFFNVTSLMNDYEAVNKNSEFFSQSLLTAEVRKGISLTAGLSAMVSSNTTTVHPTAGLQYLFANRDFVVVVLPRFDLTQTYNFETFAEFEYAPMLSKNWGIYTRFQGLYNYNIKMAFHEVNSIYLRLGVSYKNIQFGLGTNQDFYGPTNYTISNYGVFIKTNLI